MHLKICEPFDVNGGNFEFPYTYIQETLTKGKEDLNSMKIPFIT